MASLFIRPVSPSVFLSSFSSAFLSVSPFLCLQWRVMSETKRAAFLFGYSISGISATATCLSVSHRVTIQNPSVSQDLKVQMTKQALGPSESGNGRVQQYFSRGGGAAQCLMFLSCFSPCCYLWMWSVLVWLSVCACFFFVGCSVVYLCVYRPRTCLM